MDDLTLGLTSSQINRFWCKLLRLDGCWVWPNEPTGSGYGNYQPTGGVNWSVHVLAYRLVKGDLADGQLVRHTCDNKLCCNPEHLVPGTQADNMADKVERGRQAVGVKHGKSLVPTSEDVSLINSTLSTTEVSRITGISQTTIKRFRSGTHWSQK